MINLFLYQDTKYQAFNKKIINDENQKIIGIRMPIMKKIAKQLIKNNRYSEYISDKHYYFEETLLHGLILGYLNIPFSKLLGYLDDYIPQVDNWEINDEVVANLHAFKDNQEEGYNYILSLLNKSDWSKRFGLVLLLDYYVNDNYIDSVLSMASHLKSDNYYVNMANSWLISICYIKYPNKTIKLIKNKKLDDWVNNKTISKICDSKRISKEVKVSIKKYRR